jgi:tetratricopeptide (TPR) repeat protein
VRRRGLAAALAAWLAASPLAAQQAPDADVPAPDVSPDAAAALPGLDAERSRAVAAALRAGSYARAEELLVSAAQGDAAPPELLRLLGGVSFLARNYLNAAIALKKAERRAPLDEKSRFTLAMAYVVLGRRDWARPELRRLAEVYPGRALYPYWTGRLDYDTGLYAEAAQGFLRAIAADGGFVKAHDNLGLCYEALGRYEEAQESHGEAVRLNRASPSPSPWPPHNLGLLLTRLGREAEAEPLFREALRHDGAFAPAHYQLGVTLERAGRTAEAVTALQEAARRDPDYPDPHYALARVYRRQGRIADADRALATFRDVRKRKERAGPAPMR